MDTFQKIVGWNKERGILENELDHVKEASFIIEELLESTGDYNSVTARERALKYAAEIVDTTPTDKEKFVDAFADIIVFATGAIAKSGYDPSKVMDEVFKEIDSRTGKLVDGKFVKDTDVKIYHADLASCKYNK